MTKQRILIGRKDIIDLPELGLYGVKAKIDTGAYTSSIHCSRIKVVKQAGIEYITFHIPGSNIHGLGKKEFRTSDYVLKNVKSSMGHIEMRFVVSTKILIFNKRIRTEFSLTDRSTMRYPVLLGRKLLSKRFFVDVSAVNLSYRKRKIIVE